MKQKHQIKLKVTRRYLVCSGQAGTISTGQRRAVVIL